MTVEEFIKGIVQFDENTTDNYWRIDMKSYNMDGEWYGSQYTLLTAPKSYTVDDFLYHYTDAFHKEVFSKRSHGVYNKIYLDDPKTNERYLIHIYLMV
jgi:hypothetical protein